ncbi:MAG: glutamate 5-kinase [Gammaproteobacteria bacterium]|nr:glutamate 5-kinase [Gammaproteobacteria bacterium]
MEEVGKIREKLGKSKRWVVKIGSALSTNDGVGLNVSAIDKWAGQITELMAEDRQIVLVTSGSIAEGAARLSWSVRPHSLPELQAAAAVGQMGLIRAWEQAFEKHKRIAAQVLLTHEDLSDRTRYLNAKGTLSTLLSLGVIPVVNENDTVATEEISLGDNDTLAGLVCNLIEADVLVILTDQSGIMTADPRLRDDVERVEYALVDDPTLDALAGGGGEWGRGGMRTKLKAARLASRSGTSTIIADGRAEITLPHIGLGESTGTLLYSSREKTTARKQWLAGSLKVRGQIIVDAGASAALARHGKSLLAAGLVKITGGFNRGDLVELVDETGQVIGKGLTNYSSDDCARIRGMSSRNIESALGFVHEEEVVNRDNLLVEPTISKD